MFYVDINADVAQQQPDERTLTLPSVCDVNTSITMSESKASPRSSPRIKKRLEQRSHTTASTVEDTEDTNDSLFPRCKSSKYIYIGAYIGLSTMFVITSM